MFALVVAFVDDHRERFGVEPICRVLSEHGIKIAANGYYAHKKRPASTRSVRDERVLAEIVRVHTDPKMGRGLYGVRKVHAALLREGGVDGGPRLPPPGGATDAHRRAAGCSPREAVRHHEVRPVRTAAAGPGAARLHRGRAEPALGVDYTYVPTWSGMAFTAFVTDVFSRRIVGCRTASSMPTSLPLDALEMALWTRQRHGHTEDGRLNGLIHHSDAGSQYVSIRYSERLADAGAVASIGSVGDSLLTG